jgi:ribosomal protein S18 acetylase RimI-like enzyme
MQPGEIPNVSDVMAEAYVSNPFNQAAFGPNLRRNQFMMRFAMDRLVSGHQWYVAKEEGRIVGGISIVEWSNCQVSPIRMLPAIPVLIKELRSSALRLMKCSPTWAKLEPKEPHWHFGHLAVLPERQGQGIGSQLLTHSCELIDQYKAAAYLVTDKSENVRLYQRFSFEVTAEVPVLGVPHWCMWRSPRN